MRRTAMTVAAIGLTAALAACDSGNGNGNDTAHTRKITRSEIQQVGEKWPFTSDEAELACNAQAITVTISGTTYALNGTATSRHAGADLAPVWADDPALPGLKVSVGDVIDEGLKLC